MHRLTVLDHGAIPLLLPLLTSLVSSPLPTSFIFWTPFLLTWNPSSFVVRSRPPWPQVARKLTSPSPFPPHSNFLTSRGFPKSILRLPEMTSRSRLYTVRNNGVPDYRKWAKINMTLLVACHVTKERQESVYPILHRCLHALQQDMWWSKAPPSPGCGGGGE
jgi:hypothetical protein